MTKVQSKLSLITPDICFKTLFTAYNRNEFTAHSVTKVLTLWVKLNLKYYHNPFIN